MNTQESNRIIAKFMGARLVNHENVNRKMWIDYPPIHGRLDFPNTLVFNKDWNAIVPVIKKIHELNMLDTPGYVLNLADVNLAWSRIDLEEIINSIVKFIEWYDGNK